MDHTFIREKNGAISFVIFCLVLLFSVNIAGATNSDPVKIRLEKIENEISTSVRRWEISVSRKVWKTHRLHFPIEREHFTLKTTVSGQTFFSAVKVSGTPLYLKLKIQAAGFCRVEVTVNGVRVGSFEVDGGGGTPVNILKEVQIAKKAVSKNYQVRIEVYNLGFKPVRSEYWPPRKKKLPEEGIFFRLTHAQMFYSKAAGMYREISDWLTSMRTAYTLLNPDLQRFNFKGTSFPIKDKRTTSKERLNELNSILEKSVFSFDTAALKKGDSQKLKASINGSYRLAGKLREYAGEFKVYLIGNAHIDIAWLWRIHETVLVARNTYDTVIENMSEFPEFRYAQSQALTYEWMEKKYPELFEKIKKKIRSGKWEIVGGMWVEPDCNLISGESWVRQILYGKRYFKEKFGVDVKTGWNVDSFGYNRNMPQIYKKSGIDRFVTRKIWWNDTTVFPYYIFWWQGVDGTRLLSYFPPVGYTSRVEITDTMDNIVRYEATTGYKKSLVLYGIGDHGGGPNREILNRVRDYNKLFIAPDFIHAGSGDFLENIKTDLGQNIPVWRDELYLEYHRGTYTTQAGTKKANRKSESAVSAAEKLAAIASVTGSPYPQKDLETAWKLILTNQFHDILPGSSITPVYRDALESYEKAGKKISKVQKNALTYIVDKINTIGPAQGTPLFVFNPLSWKRSDFVTVQWPSGRGRDLKILDPQGKEIPLEIETDEETGQLNIFFIATDIPPIGWRIFSIVKGKSRADSSPLKTRGSTLENSFYRITVNPETGNIKHFFDKKLQREFIPADREANVLQVYEDKPEKWDAWNIGYTGRYWELNRPDSIDIVNKSPVRVVLRIKKSFLGFAKTRYSPTETFPSSFFTQYITLYRDMDRVDIKTVADWWEEHMFLKAAFPVNVKSDAAVYEIPFAAVQRTTGFKTLWEKARFEVPALKWADLSQEEYGISLLNDCKYGYDIHGSVMKISLLRSPAWPDPTADRGKHTFVYSLYAHKGKWNEAETVKRACELNTPLITKIAASHRGILPAEFSFCTVQAAGVVLDTIKKEENGTGFILRLYEARGKDEKTEIRLFKNPTAVYETDLMENTIKEKKHRGGTISLDFKKFEIKTVLVRFAHTPPED